MKTIGLVSHDNKKMDMVEWCNTNKDKLNEYKLYNST